MKKVAFLVIFLGHFLTKMWTEKVDSDSLINNFFKNRVMKLVKKVNITQSCKYNR